MNEFARNAKEMARDTRQAKLRRDAQLRAWREILKLPAGRTVILELLNYCKVFVSTWDPSAAVHKNEGMRIVGLHILEEIKEADVASLGPMLAAPYLEEVREKLARETEKVSGAKKEQEPEADAGT